VKWVGLAIILAAIFPLSAWLRRNPSHAPKIWALVGFLPFILNIAHLVMAMAFVDDPISHHVQGAEFSVLDGLVLALYFSLPRARYSLPFQFVMAFYFGAVVLSAFQSLAPVSAFFYPWQLVRMFVVYAVVAKACDDSRVVPGILSGMAVGIFLEAAVALWQRLDLHMLQASGTFEHQNILGMVSHFVVFPFFALLLDGRGRRFSAFVVLAGVIVELLTTSRATISFAALAFATVFLLSGMAAWTSRKALILFIGIAALSVVAPLAISYIAERGDTQISESNDERESFVKAAAAILSDHPMGVGANGYVVAANTGGYNAAAGVPWTSFDAFVHNVYWLVAAETGYPGLIAFVILLFRPMCVAFFCGWHNRRDPRGHLLLGFGVALLAVYIHSLFEWVFIKAMAQYILAMEFGMIAGLTRQLGYWQYTPSELAFFQSGHRVNRSLPTVSPARDQIKTAGRPNSLARR
jgi:hypothetical protein